MEAIHYCMDHAQPGDVIVLCGKGHETYQEIQHVSTIWMSGRSWRSIWPPDIKSGF